MRKEGSEERKGGGRKESKSKNAFEGLQTRQDYAN